VDAWTGRFRIASPALTKAESRGPRVCELDTKKTRRHDSPGLSNDVRSYQRAGGVLVRARRRLRDRHQRHRLRFGC